MGWFGFLFLELITIGAAVTCLAQEGYWRALGWLLVIPLLPFFSFLIGHRFWEVRMVPPSEFFCSVSISLYKFLAYLPINPWSYGIRYPLDCMADICLLRERFSESEAFARQAITIRKGEKSLSHPVILLTMSASLREQAKFLASETYARQALELIEITTKSGCIPTDWDRPVQAQAWMELSLSMLEQGLYQSAEAASRRAIEVLDNTPTGINRSAYELVTQYCHILNALGNTLLAQDKVEESHSTFKRVADIARKAFGDLNELRLKAIIGSSSSCLLSDKVDEAEQSLARAREIFQQTKVARGTKADLDCAIASLKLHQGALQETEMLLTSALSVREEISGSRHPRIADLCMLMARSKLAGSQPGDAEIWFKRAIEIYQLQEPVNGQKLNAATSQYAAVHDNIDQAREGQCHIGVQDGGHTDGQ